MNFMAHKKRPFGDCYTSVLFREFCRVIVRRGSLDCRVKMLMASCAGEDFMRGCSFGAKTGPCDDEVARVRL